MEIVADEIDTRISLNGTLLLERKVPFRFSVDNRYEYCVGTSAFTFAHMEPQKIIVEIGIILEKGEIRATNSSERNPQEVSFRRDLRCLADDLRVLALTPILYNVDLYSSDDKLLRAHSYILSIRWSNFFQRHPFDTAANTVVKTKISSDLLCDILVYMYSSHLPTNFSDNANLEYMAELFQAIDWYGIYHLYRVFVKTDVFQLRISKKSEHTKSYEFKLQFDNDAPVKDGSFTVDAQYEDTILGHRDRQAEFLLQIEVRNWNGTGAWLSYSLRSRSDFWVYARVNLELLKTKRKGRHERVRVESDSILAHAHSYTIGPFKTIESGPILFLGCLETFGDLLYMVSQKLELRSRLNVNFTDGTSLDQFHSFYRRLQDDMSRFKVLSNHMHELCASETHADRRLESRPEGGGGCTRAVRFVHRAIWDSRIPGILAVMIGIEPERDPLEVATVNVSPRALPYVVDYIYTGRVVNAPRDVLEEMLDFANRGQLHSLCALIGVLRSNLGAAV